MTHARRHREARVDWIVRRDAAREKVTRLLLDLGDSPEAIALNLGFVGVTGERDTLGRCPLVTYLARHGHDAVIGIFAPDVYPTVWLRPNGAARPLPSACAEFVTRFDAGDFSELVTPSEWW